MSTNPFSLEAVQQRQKVEAPQIPDFDESTSLPPVEDNPFSAAAIERSRSQQLRSNLIGASKANPDQTAKAIALTKRTGIPTDVVARNLLNVEMQDAVDRADEQLQTSPVLRRRMMEKPLFAKEAHDDVQALSGVETLFREGIWAGRTAVSGLPSFTAGAYGVLETALRVVAPLADPLAGTILPENPIRRVAEGIAGVRRGQQQLAQTVGGELPDDAGIIRRGVRAGLQSVGQQAPGLAASVVTGNPAFALAGAGIGTGGASATQAMDQGMEPIPATIFGLSQASIEIATERIPVSRLLGDIGAGTGLMRMLGRQAAAEVPGEQVATVLQDLNEWAVLPENREKPFSAYLAERPSAAAETLIATIVGTSVQTGGARALASAADRIGAQQQKAQEAEQSAQGVARLFEAVTATKLQKRDPEALAETVQEIAEESGAAEVYVDAQSFAQALNQSGMAELLERMPSVAEQLQEAVATGGDLAVPMGELSMLAGTPLAEIITPLLRRDPDAWTQAEAQQFGQQETETLRTQADQALTEAEQTAVATQQAQVVRDDIMGQLTRARRFTDDVNAAYADFVRDFYATQSQRLGVTPDQLYQQYPLRVVAQSPVRSGPVLNQDAQEGGGHPAAAPGEAGTPASPAPGGPSAAAAPRALFDPQTNTIAVLQGADLTSFLHESGHFYLEVLADLASQPNAPAQIQGDMQSLLEWFGFDGPVDQWRAQTLEQRREAHEQFARGFEAYLFEGNAPNPQVYTLFQRFRSWLKQIYKSISALNVTLTDEVRGVMDRMLATDEQIQSAEAAAGYMPLFETAEAAGMTPDQFLAYQRQAEEATAQAQETLERRSLRDLKWFEGAKSRELRKLQKSARAQRDAVRVEAAGEVEAIPAVQAREFLRGKKPSELELEAVAEQFGFASADHMLTTIAETPVKGELIKAITDQRMFERHGDLIDPASMERAAMEAVHNATRGRLVAAEMKALQEMNDVREGTGTDKRGRARSVNVLARAARQFASESIARKKIRDIRPGQYTVAEGKAGRQAAEALRRGDTAAAAIAKRNQLLNHYGARTAVDALAEVDKGVAYLNRFNRDVKSIDVDYLDQIHQLLEQFDIRRGQSLRAVDKRKSLMEWVESQREQGFDPLIDDALLAEAGKVHYRDLTVEAFKGLVDTVRNIEHLGRLKRKLLVAQDAREFSEIEDAIEALIRSNARGVKPVELEGRTGARPWLDGFAAGHRKVSSLMRQMSGGQDGGALWDAFVRPMNERATFEAVESEKATMALAELYKPILAMPGGTTGDKRHIPAIGASLTRGGRLAVALNWGNDTNRRRVMEGDGWNQYQVQSILNTLSRDEWTFVQGVWDHIDTYWSQIAEKERRVSGVVPEKVQADPFEITLADGSVISLEGGYYPIKYDSQRSAKAEQHEGADLARDMLRGVFSRATTRRGHTKARQETVNRPIRKDLSVVTEHVAQVVHDLAWHEWLIDANRILGSDSISHAIRETQGVEVLRTIKDAVQAIATADVVPQTKVDRALMYLRSNVSRSTMGFSLTTALLQPFGLTQSMVRIGPQHVLRGVARWGGDALRFENSMGWIGEKSDFMRLRSKTFNRELHEIKGRVSQGQSQARQIIDASLFALMQKMQMVADVPTWIGQYEKSLAQGLDDATAVAQADQAVIDAQGGGQIKDLAEFQRKHPMLTMFYSYFSTTYNLAAESTASTNFKNPAAMAGWLSDMALLLVIPSMLPNLVIALLQGWSSDEPEEWAKKLFEWQVSFLMATVVGVREFAGLVSGFDYSGPPSARVVADAGKLNKQLQQGDMDEPLAMATIRFFGTLFGIPTTQLTRSYRGWKAWDEGDAPLTSILFGPPPRD